MGAKCCMPVRDDMPMVLRKKDRVPHELYSRRSSRCSPSWSFRCDNRTHIEDIVDNPSWLSHESGGSAVSEFISTCDGEIEGLSDGSSSSNTLQLPKLQKLPNELNIKGNSQTGLADLSPTKDTSHEESEIRESSSPANASEPKQSSTAHTASVPNLRFCSPPSNPSSPHPFPGHRFSPQISEGQVLASDSWIMQSFSQLYQSDNRASTHLSSSTSNLQTCCLCSKLVTERATWKGNEITVAAVLVCGHVFHAECLETVTPEASKFDPSCPTCFHGENSSGNALITCSKSRNKISRGAVADINGDGKLVMKDLKLGASISVKNALGWSFLRKHLAFGSRSIKHSSKSGSFVRYR
ncbi:uncharacterized protein LOC109840688 isoform X2 [Asparagus officinalis]|uniref:uncharacterized protein LOC109840688 isoform X2 n=1 Tax=Asparagus officinalis TaxID=4686 RepID=UPI00098E0306|nr:uncharacterized protein LOC109840688 isoform X2 [Asparagus officinalis]